VSPKDKKFSGSGQGIVAGSWRLLIERWRYEYNHFRPHSSLAYRPPAPEAIEPPPSRLDDYPYVNAGSRVSVGGRMGVAGRPTSFIPPLRTLVATVQHRGHCGAKPSACVS